MPDASARPRLRGLLRGVRALLFYFWFVGCAFRLWPPASRPIGHALACRVPYIGEARREVRDVHEVELLRRSDRAARRAPVPTCAFRWPTHTPAQPTATHATPCFNVKRAAHRLYPPPPRAPGSLRRSSPSRVLGSTSGSARGAPRGRGRASPRPAGWMPTALRTLLCCAGSRGDIICQRACPWLQTDRPAAPGEAHRSARRC